MSNREIDRRVAEILGYKIERFGNGNEVIITGMGDGLVSGYYPSTVPIPRYSADPAAALSALEEFCMERELDWDIWSERDVVYSRWVYHCITRKRGTHRPQNSLGYDLVLSVAICAALIAAAERKGE